MTDDVDLTISGGPIATMDDRRRVFDPGYLAIKDGIIVDVGPMPKESVRTERHISSVEKVVLPGLINCHTHLSNGIHRGLYDEFPLQDWLREGLWPVVRASTRMTRYEGARVSLAENLLSGVTTVSAGEFAGKDNQSVDGVFEAVRESGIRAIIARIGVDSPTDGDPSQAVPLDIREEIDDVISEVERLRNTYSSSLIQVIPEPLGVLRCTPDMIRALTEFARSEQSRMTMHVASSLEERAESERRYGIGPIEKLAELDTLGSHLTIAHCVWPNDNEITMLAETWSGVSHNPVSNLMYGVGISPLSELLDAGVLIGLGTDGASTNNGQNLWETMKMAVFLQKYRLGAAWGSAELALELATLGGAQAIGMGDQIGSLEPGKRADLIILDLNVPGFLPSQTWPSNLVYSHSREAVRTVVVDGNIVVNDGALVAWSLEEVVEGANVAAQEIEARTKLASKYRSRSRWAWSP